VDNIKIDLREIEWDGMDWLDLAQDRDQCALFDGFQTTNYALSTSSLADGNYK
jgi:hypothetical protein